MRWIVAAVFALGWIVSGHWVTGQALLPDLTLKGFSTPESVVVDPATGLAYVSNMATPPETYWTDTGKGFLSRLRADGTLDALRWLDSSPTFVLNQPKGMAIQQGRLYVADNTRVLVVSLADARPLAAWSIAGSKQLNDMAGDGRSVYVSDTATGKILRLNPDEQGRPETVGQIAGINGITIHQDTLYGVSWTLHELFEVALAGALPPRALGLAHHFTNLDGIEPMPDGTFIVSDFVGNRVVRLAVDRQYVQTLCTLSSPADVGVDRARMRLYVPQLESDQVAVFTLAHPESVSPPP